MKIIIVGKSASGKDYLKNLYKSKGFKVEVSYTTREPRENEINGIDYNFVSKSTFLNMINNLEMFEYVKFGDHYYGTSLKNWNTCNVFIMTPGALSKLPDDELSKCLVIYLDCTESIRKFRLKRRNWTDEKINKRLTEDNAEFLNFNKFDIKLENNEN